MSSQARCKFSESIWGPVCGHKIRWASAQVCPHARLYLSVGKFRKGFVGALAGERTVACRRGTEAEPVSREGETLPKAKEKAWISRGRRTGKIFRRVGFSVNLQPHGVAEIPTAHSTSRISGSGSDFVCQGLNFMHRSEASFRLRTRPSTWAAPAGGPTYIFTVD